MEAGLLSTASIAFVHVLDWVRLQDPALTLAAGALIWFVIERAMGIVDGWDRKLIILVSAVVTIMIGSAIAVDASGVWREGETIPLESRVKTPNADFFTGDER